MTATAVLPQRKRDPREKFLLHVELSEQIEEFENMLNMGLSNDTIGRYFSKESFVRIALYYMNRGQEVGREYADFEELTNEVLV